LTLDLHPFPTRRSSDLLIILLCFSSSAFAELAYVDPVTNQSVLDQVVQKFGGKVKSWQTIVQGAAERLFWTLVLISMVWTFGMIDRKSTRLNSSHVKIS